MPFESDYLCTTCRQTDRSCPFLDFTTTECQFYAPDLPRVYQPYRKPEMTAYAAVDALLKELERAQVKHPVWPTNTLEQVAVMAGEAGECLQAALHYVEGRGDIERVRAEAIQVGAMAIRVLMNLEWK